MGQSNIQLATDGTGKKIDTQVTAAAAQHRQVMVIGDPSTDANVAAVGANGLKVDPLSSLKAPSATITSVSGSASTTSLLAANSSRNGVTFYSNSTVNLYLAFASTSSSSVFTVKLPPGGYFEVPFPVYTGQISGIWDSATGAVLITEM